MTETVTLPSQFKLKQEGQGGKWQPWVIQYICELLVIGTPPAIISSSYQTYYGKEPDEVPQISFVRQCRVGMVQANVGQKLLKRNIFKSFYDVPFL